MLYYLPHTFIKVERPCIFLLHAFAIQGNWEKHKQITTITKHT